MNKIAQGWKVGGYKAAKNGKSVIMGNIKGIFKGIGKRMPVIGSLLILLGELPNILKATKEEGIVQGAAETAKAGARLAGGTVLGALGTALGGPIGGIVGFIVGDWLTSKVVGKSYSERKFEDQEEQAALTQQSETYNVYNPYNTNMSQPKTPSPQELAMYQQLLYSNNMNNDFMANAYKQPQFNIQA